MYKPSNIMLIPSSGCQGSCRYCFGPHEGGVMPDAVLDAAAEFCGALFLGRPAGRITFHGGEPLLAGYDWFERALKVLSNATRRRAHFSMQSNLWLLDQRFVDLFAQYNVAVSTSLDGGRDICDSQRGAGCFDKTMAGIRLLRKNGLETHCIATLLPENVHRIPEIIAFFEGEGLRFSLRGAEPSFEHGEENALPDGKAQELYKSVLAYMEQSPAPARIRDVEAFIDGAFHTKSALCTFSNCVGHYAAIDPEGGVYTCQRFCGMEEFRIGTVSDSPEEMEKSEAYRRIAGVHEAAKQSCGDCGHFAYCNGGCAYNVLVAQRHGRPWPRCNDATPSGRVYRELFDHVLEKLAAETAGLMLGEKAATPYLAAAGDQPHPGDAARGRARYEMALAWGKTGAPKHAFAHRRRANMLYLNITSNCPLRCAHCGVQASAGNADMPFDTAIGVIHEAAELGFRALSLNGGEPLIYREILPLLRQLEQLRGGGIAFSMFTSLFPKLEEETASLALRALDHISVSLDGGAAAHDARRGAGAFAQTCANLAQLAELNRSLGNPCRLLVRASLTNEQRAEGIAGDIREAAALCGVKEVNISPVLPIGRAKDLGLGLSAPKAPDDAGRFFSSFVPKNSCGLCTSPHITPDGEVYPCWAFVEEGKPLGNLRDGLHNVLFDTLWGSGGEKYCVDKRTPCGDCEVRYVCGGTCRGYEGSDCSALQKYYKDGERNGFVQTGMDE